MSSATRGFLLLPLINFCCLNVIPCCCRPQIQAFCCWPCQSPNFHLFLPSLFQSPALYKKKSLECSETTFILDITITLKKPSKPSSSIYTEPINDSSTKRKLSPFAPPLPTSPSNSTPATSYPILTSPPPTRTTNPWPLSTSATTQPGFGPSLPKSPSPSIDLILIPWR